MKFGTGQPVRRREDVRFLTGAGRYVDDIRLPGQTVAGVLRSPVAHGTITALDLEAARAVPGVHLVWGHGDIAGRLTPMANDFPLSPAAAPVLMPHLADGTVRFVGQPIAFVVADSRAAVLDALEAISLEITDQPCAIDPVAALEPNAPQLHADAPGNLAYAWECGDGAAVDAALAAAAHVISTPVLNQRVAVVSIEPRGILISHDPATGRWEGWVGCQGAHGMRAKIARALGVEAERVRIHVPDVGGAFGMKLMDHPEYGLCALAARDLGRPVKWVGERGESFLSDAQGRDMRGTVTGAFDADGRCRAIRLQALSGLGAYYSSFGAGVHTAFSAPILGGMYRIEAMHAQVRGVFTNTPPTDAYRGAGRPEVIYATERLIEAAARKLGLDPADIRRRNLVTPAMLPHSTPGGAVFDSLDPATVIARAEAAADRPGFESRAAAALPRLRGLGLAYYMERTGGGPVENTRMTLTGDGNLRIWIGTQSTGQGHETAWAQVVHEQTGLPFERIDVMAGDSDALAQGGGTGGSRSLIMASRVILAAADDLIAQGRARAAEHLEAAEGDIEFHPAACQFRVAGTDRSVGLVALAAEPITATGAVGDRTSTYPNGCHIAEVEIDPDTGALEILRYTVIDDFGRLINPALVLGQVHGGIAQGIGQVIGEAAQWDAGGQPLTASLMDYVMPRASDLPMMAVAFEEVPCLTNPFGVKGCGESGSVGGIPATALAAHDALHRAGAAPIETPLTAPRLWAALRTARG